MLTKSEKLVLKKFVTEHPVLAKKITGTLEEDYSADAMNSINIALDATWEAKDKMARATQVMTHLFEESYMRGVNNKVVRNMNEIMRSMKEVELGLDDLYDQAAEKFFPS